MKLKKEFEDFYDEIRINEEQEPLREKRKVLEEDIKSKLPRIMEQHGIALNKSDIRMIDQGSYKYKTTIKAPVFDRDVAVIIPLDLEENEYPKEVKQFLYDAIDIPARTVEFKEPCVRAVYKEDGEERYHIDLPLYAEDEAGNMYLARGKKSSQGYWEEADPDGLNEDLCEKLSGNDQLRRVICYIKKWKNEEYKNAQSDHEIPPSIGLTYLACDCFSGQSVDGEDDDLTALYKTMKSIMSQFRVGRDYSGEIVSVEIHRYLTVKPKSDIFGKMMGYSNDYMISFYKRFSKAVNNLENAVNVETDHEAAIYVRKVLGDEFIVPAKRAVETITNAKREHNFG